MAGRGTRRAGPAGALAILVTAAGACVSPGVASNDAEPAGSAEVDAFDNTFRPGTLEVAPNTEVVWRNVGRSDHNVLPVEGDDWGVEADDFGPDDEYGYTFTEPGTYEYYCSLHGTTTAGMVGTVVVTG